MSCTRAASLSPPPTLPTSPPPPLPTQLELPPAPQGFSSCLSGPGMCCTALWPRYLSRMAGCRRESGPSSIANSLYRAPATYNDTTGCWCHRAHALAVSNGRQQRKLVVGLAGLHTLDGLRCLKLLVSTRLLRTQHSKCVCSPHLLAQRAPTSEHRNLQHKTAQQLTTVSVVARENSCTMYPTASRSASPLL